MWFNLLSHIWCTYTENVGDNQQRFAKLAKITRCTYTENIGDNQRTFAVENATFGCTNFIREKREL